MPIKPCNCGTTAPNSTPTTPTAKKLGMDSSVSTKTVPSPVYQPPSTKKNGNGVGKYRTQKVEPTKSATGSSGCGIPTITGGSETKAVEVIRDLSKSVSVGAVCPAPSLAKWDAAQHTMARSHGYITLKDKEDSCLFYHLDSKCGGFVYDLGDGQGQVVTTSPKQEFPLLQGYLTDAQGNVLVDQSGSPILAPAPLFTDIIVSGADLGEECLDKRLFAMRAPSSSVPMVPFSMSGNWMIGELYGNGFCSTSFPEVVNTGGILVNRSTQSDVVDPTNPESWCVEEYDAGCGILFQGEDEEGNTSLNTLSFSGLGALTEGEGCSKSGMVLWTQSCNQSCATPSFIDMELNAFIDLSQIPSQSTDQCEARSYLLKLDVACDGTISQSLVKCETEAEKEVRAQLLVDAINNNTLSLDDAKLILNV